MCFSSCNDDLRSMHNGPEREFFTAPHPTYLYTARMDGLEIQLGLGAREICYLRKASLAIMNTRNLLKVGRKPMPKQRMYLSQVKSFT